MPRQPADKGPEWWQALRKKRWRGHLSKPWHEAVPLTELMQHPIGEKSDLKRRLRSGHLAPEDADRLLALIDKGKAERPPRRWRSMVDRFGIATPVYRALSTEGDTWGTLVSAFWGSGVKLTDQEFWDRGYVEAAAGGRYRITRKGIMAIWSH